MNPEQNKKRGGARLSKPAQRTAAAETKEPGAPKAPKPKGTKRKRPKVKRTPAQQALHVGFIVLTVLAGVIVVAAVALKLFVQKPSQGELVRPSRNPVQDPTVSMDPLASPPPPVSSDRKEDFWTFLVVGRDTYGGGNTDTILLAAYDIPNQAFSVMSIPRDTLVNVSWDIKKINSVYNMYGGAKDGKGIDALKDEVSQLVGYRPDFTVVVEWKAVGELVNAIGGVDFDVPRRMYYNDLSQNFKIDLKKGMQHLNGSQAMQLLRYRHDSDDNGNILNSGYANGDLGRIQTQQDFLKATIEQTLKSLTAEGPIKGVQTIAALAQVFFDNVTTELSVGELAYFAQQAVFGNDQGRKLDMSSVSFITMPWVSADGVWSRTYKNHPSYVAPNVSELVKLVNEKFNPFVDDLDKSELDIMYVNKDGTLGCTGGALEDTKYNDWVRNGGYKSFGGSAATPTPAPSESAEPSPTPDPDTSPDPNATPSPPGTPDPNASPAPAPGGSDQPPPASPGAPESQEPPPSQDVPTPPVSAAPSAPPAGQEPVPTPNAEEGPPEGIPIYGSANDTPVLPARPQPVQTSAA